jgi:hypothetical protein
MKLIPRSRCWIVLFSLIATACFAQEAREDNNRDVVFLPTDRLYLPYVADPHRLGFAIQALFLTDTDVAESGSPRIGLKTGGRFGIVRFNPDGRSDRALQFSIEGGFDSQFDTDHSLDNIGWDGNYGLILSKRLRSDLVCMLGLLHTSSHVGDEYTERIGRERIGYTREEIAAGMSWNAGDDYRFYAESAWGHELRIPEVQDPGRIQLGFEYEASAHPAPDRPRWYAAADLSAMEERDWHIDTSLQSGIVRRVDGRTWRFGIERYDGRVPIGEFFQDTELYYALGVWIDI